MKLLQNYLLKELNLLKKKKYIDRYVLSKQIQRLKNNPNVIKRFSLSDHFCAFFMPIHKPSRSTYLVHHIKANDWIPPGGHIDENENPIDTVKREFYEELGHRLDNEAIELFDVSYKRGINDPKGLCKIHYDLWYTVDVNKKIDFAFLKKEFYNAGWFTFDEAIKKCKFSRYNKILQKVRLLFQIPSI